MSRAQRYQVIDRMGQTCAEGTVEECGAALGRNAHYIRSLIEGAYSYPEYWVVPVAGLADKSRQWGHEELIKKWDDFVTPIREAYGIPRYRPKGANK